MEKFYFFNSFLDTAKAIEDEKLRWEYLMAVAEYWIEGKESDNPIIKALMVQTKFVLDRSKEMSEQKSEKMKGNKNAVKTWEKQWKQTKTDKNSEEQKKQEEEVEEEIEGKEIKEKFELFWKEFPHARKGKKQEAKNNFIKQDSEKVMEEIKLLNWKIKLWLQDAKYIPACERRIRDFVPTSDVIKKQVMEQIVAKHMEMEGMKERYPLLKQDFWEETMNKLVMEYNNKHKTKLSFNY